MIALCPACHEVKHIGLAGIRGRADIARGHLAEVNGWELREADRYIEEAFAVWQKRSTRSWSLDISALSAYDIDASVISGAGGVSAKDRSQSVSSITRDVANSSQDRPF
jgi:hypothetical protein